MGVVFFFFVSSHKESGFFMNGLSPQAQETWFGWGLMLGEQ